MQIQKCKESQISRAGEFYDRVVKWLDDHTNYPRWIYGEYPSENTVRERTEEGAQFICLLDGTIIGAFALDPVPQGSYWKGRWSRKLPDGSFLFLHTLAIDPEIRRQGIGSEIIRFCIEKAKTEGFKAIRLATVPDNYPAKAFFEKNGFAYAGDADLEREVDDIPLFSLYELNFEDDERGRVSEQSTGCF